MKQHPLHHGWGWAFVVALVLLGRTLPGYAADQVDMKNGERYLGKIVSLTADSLVLESQLAGTIKLPRSKIDTIRLNAPPVAKEVVTGTNRPVIPSASVSSNSLAKAARSGEISTADAEGSVASILEGASPEARAKFNQMVAGLLSGRMTTEDIRKEARTVAEQARSLRKDLGGEAGDVIDSYLAVLDRFLGEMPSAGSVTNKPSARSP
jgi:hypothetical protein